MDPVSPHVYIDPDYGGCTVGAIKTPEGVVLVDSPKQPTRAIRWREEVKALGEVRYLINTEHHIDHIFGNFFFPGTIISHQETKERFWKDSVLGPNPLKDPKGHVARIDPQGVGLVAQYRAREPEITFDGRLMLSLGGMTIEVFGMPGHVPADTAVYVPGDRVLFTSDNVFHETMTWYHEALPFEWLETLDHFKGMEVEVVVPGHGRATGPQVFDEMRQVVEEAIGEVKSAIDSGMSREEAMERITFIDRQPVPEEHRPRAPMLQRLFVGRIYDQILARRS
jgi:glyoxylase-like metal-dependent hydrolase (beta-lactamase superfamily II)